MKNPRTRVPGVSPGNRAPEPQRQFREFQATELYCPRCRQAVPVRERLLLVLPEGDKYEYLCAYCGTSVGDRIVKDTEPMNIIV